MRKSQIHCTWTMLSKKWTAGYLFSALLTVCTVSASPNPAPSENINQPSCAQLLSQWVNASQAFAINPTEVKSKLSTLRIISPIAQLEQPQETMLDAATMSDLEAQYDVISRKAGQFPGVMHEVDAAFKAIGGLPLYRLDINSSQNTSRRIVEKVFTTDYRETVRFAGLNTNRLDNIRYYAIVFPKGFIAKFGMIGNGVTRDTTKLKMRELGSFPFLVRNEVNSGIGERTQVHVFSKWLINMGDDTIISIEQFFERYAIGVVEFNKDGQIIQQQNLQKLPRP